jgi:hypothetical protein
MEAIFSSETSVDTQRTTRRYIPEVYTLQIISYSVFKSFSILSLSYELYGSKNRGPSDGPQETKRWLFSKTSATILIKFHKFM